MIMNYSATSSCSSFPDAQPFIGVVENTLSALRLVQAAKMGIIPRIVRRLNDSERQDLIVPGAVLVFSVEESGIKRWTDGRLWSPSRIVGNFLVYKEMREKSGSRNQKSSGGPEDSSRRGETRKIQWDAPDAIRLQREPSRPHSSSLSGTLKTGGLIKKTITVTIEGSDLHLISYYTQEDVQTGRLRRLATRPDIANLILEPRIFRLGSFRNPPKVIKGPDGNSTIAPEPEEVEPPEFLTDGLPHRASGSPEYRIGATDVSPLSIMTTAREHQSVHQGGSSTTSVSPGYASTWREDYGSAHTMVDQYQQSTRWTGTTSNTEAHRTDGYLDYRRPDHERRGGEQQQNWPGSPTIQYPEVYAQSPSETTMFTQREVAGLSDGSGYEERVGLPTLYGNPQNPDQRTQSSRQNHHVGSAYPLGWPTSAQRHEYSSDSAPVATTTLRPKPAQPQLILPPVRQMYTTDGHWSANTSPSTEHTVSPVQPQAARSYYPDPEQTYYSYRSPAQEGTVHHYKVEEYESGR